MDATTIFFHQPRLQRLCDFWACAMHVVLEGRLFSMDYNCFVGLALLFLSVAFLFRHHVFPAKKRSSFPFMKLPPELREDIYRLITERTPTYPRDNESVSVPQRHFLSAVRAQVLSAVFSPIIHLCGSAWASVAQLCRGTRHSFQLLRPLRNLPRVAAPSAVSKGRVPPSIGPLLASRKMHFEYIAYLCRTTPFHLTIGDVNSHLSNPWPISPILLSQIRQCTVTIKTTARMMSPFNPNHATGPWSVRDNIANLLATQMPALKEVRLMIRAFGDQTWNPLRIWHYASQSFKEVQGGKVRTIGFRLDNTWPVLSSVNHLGRDEKDEWVWCCPEGHELMKDCEGWQPVRQFCGALYSECEVCKEDGVSAAS